MHNDYDPAMTRAGNVLIGLAVLLGGALAACSIDDASPAATTVADTVAPTTEPTVDTTSPTTTTDAPTTTADPADALAAAVEADFLEADRLGREASQDPFNAEKEQAALDRLLGDVASGFETELEGYRATNYALRPNPDVTASITLEKAATLIEPSTDVVQIQICEVDSWLVVEVGAGPNGTDAIVNPEIVSYRSTVFLRRVDGIWRVEGGNEIARWEGATSCAD